MWAGLNAAASVLLPFALFVFFAREITPSLLGLIALAMACTEVCKAIGLPGIYEALLQQKNDLKRCHEAALALLLSASCLLVPICLLIIFGLGFLVHGLHAHFVLLSMLVLRIPLDLASVQPQAVLVARLAFRRLAVRTIMANVIAGCVGVVITRNVNAGAGLVIYQLVQSIVTFVSTSFGSGLLVRPRFHWDCIRRLRRETLLATGNRTLAATINSVDQMLIAPLAGNIGLAYYNLGKRLETTFVTVANSFSAILFQPLFAAEGGLSKQKTTVRALLVLGLVCGIPASVVFCNSRVVVGLIFGRTWLPAAPIVAWLSLNGFVRAIGMVPGSFLSVSGRNRELLTTSIVSAIGSLALVALIASKSITLCAFSLVIKNALIVAWMAWLSRREVQQPALTYTASVLVPIVLMIGAVSAIKSMLPMDGGAGPMQEITGLLLSCVGALCCGGVAMAFAYLLSLRSLDRPMPARLHA
ncbi:oligosaccharide flippase family protein [Lichenicola cladoniae]|uniref:Oligosaccharide flippase family protein n=1 Tax=Lichenicola cladoniae TaxID=1484109 RepID=A0A6M8H559_9PROT|nr:oligosaccharide flippase family protein [Lichenicola cladoniae]NPD65146.1 oligosaccharide flippase family protein [Acetobacteraceae bacterium]QKE88751.1 oligosaccharide flippase family protein [Lichenicola cladoniae]